MIAYALWLLAAVSTIGLGVWAWRQYPKPRPWVDIAPGVHWTGASDKLAVERAWALASVALYKHLPELNEKLSAAAVYVTVKPSNTWVDAWGRRVGGQTWEPNEVEVGLDLSALVHELIHLTEARAGLDKSNCLFWQFDGDKRGEADRAYRVALAGK